MHFDSLWPIPGGLDMGAMMEKLSRRGSDLQGGRVVQPK